MCAPGRWSSIVIAAAIACLPASAVEAATCVWNSASGDWSLASNWIGCADSPGPSTRSPGATDIALVVNGVANLAASPTVAELELGANGEIHTTGSTRMLTVTGALRLNGGRTTTVLGTNQLHLILPPGASGSLLAPTVLEDATFVMNSGTLALGSSNGTSLGLKRYAQLQNLPGGVITLAGGDSRIDLMIGAEISNAVGASIAISGNARIGLPAPETSAVYLYNRGAFTMNGPGTLLLAGSGGGGVFNLRQTGDFTLTNATVQCNNAASQCTWSDADSGNPDPLPVTRLANATIDLGAATASFPLNREATLTGSGAINGRLGSVQGLLAPGALTGQPYGTLAVSGGAQVGLTASLDFDLGPGGHDRLELGGQIAVGVSFGADGYGALLLRLAAGYAPAAGTTAAIASYASVAAGAGFNVVQANHTLDYAVRFDPTELKVFPAPRLILEDATLVEGNAGQATMSFNVRLSQASSLPVTVTDLRDWNGTANNPSDYTSPIQSFTFAPGETLKTAVATVKGDTVVEGDEAFTLYLERGGKLVNAAYGNGVRGRLSAVGTIATDDLPPGTRFVLVGKDAGTTGEKIRRYTTDGTFIDSWSTGMTSGLGYIVTGMCFSPTGNVLATRFGWQSPVLYSRHGARLDADFGFVTLGVPGFNYHESCVFDRSGNAYIGQAGGSGASDNTVPVLKFSPAGVLVKRHVIPTGERGTDWIELAGDQCTLYYTSEETTVLRYNLCTETPMSALTTTLSGPYCYALRLRPNGELLVACRDAVHRLSTTGLNLQTYTRASIGENDPNGLFALNLDPDGTSFWTAGATSGMLYRVDIASGSVLAAFSSGSGGVSGLAVYDELGDDRIFQHGFDPAPPAPAPAKSTLPCAALLLEPHDAVPHFIPSWLDAALGREGDCLAE